MSGSLCIAIMFVLTEMGTLASPEASGGIDMRREGGVTYLSLGMNPPFHSTQRTVSDRRTLAFPESRTKVVTWTETGAGSADDALYGISLDGTSVATVEKASYELKLKFAHFDPRERVPQTPAPLRADDGNRLWIVQFITQPLEEYRSAVVRLGGTIHGYLAQYAYVVEMDNPSRVSVEALPFVRWVGPFEPAYKVEPQLLEVVLRGDPSAEPQRYVVAVFESGLAARILLAERIRAIGGAPDVRGVHGFLLESTLTKGQLRTLLHWNEVRHVGRRRPVEFAMDLVRELDGANYVESFGFTGEGVRAEVMDGDLIEDHADWALEPVLHGDHCCLPAHGTSVYGIVFGSGYSHPYGLSRGMMPDAQGIFADIGNLTLISREDHTRELVGLKDHDPILDAVFQTNSWGSGPTDEYTDVSEELDDIIFKYDIVILHAMGNNYERPSEAIEQAWAKNVVAVGGVWHWSDPNISGHYWDSGGAKTGPAPGDNRIKPDFIHFYDHVLTSKDSSPYYGDFGGTSAATPITAGHFGLFFQMWHEGLFKHVCTDSWCQASGGGASVFASRPHAATARAMMVNTASAYPVSQNWLTREVQGWGRANVRNLYDMRNKFFIIDESKLLTNLQTVQYAVHVADDEPTLKATLVYSDPPGDPACSQARINDLSLKVTAPGGTVYWGNNGMDIGQGDWSTSGGSRNTKDTVENVFIQNPASGIWTVEVQANEVVKDGHVVWINNDPADGPVPEQPVDVDFALVVSGISDETNACCVQPFGDCLDLDPTACDALGGDYNPGETCTDTVPPIFTCAGEMGPQGGGGE